MELSLKLGRKTVHLEFSVIECGTALITICDAKSLFSSGAASMYSNLYALVVICPAAQPNQCVCHRDRSMPHTSALWQG